jgi:tetratricopeptide (TPR) repeat protein
MIVAGLIKQVKSSKKKQVMICVILLVIVNVLLYFQTLNYTFLKDDHRLVVENHRIKSISAFVHSLDDKFFSFPDFAFLHYWRPMVILSFLGDHMVWQLNPMGYHLTNILLNLAVVLILYMIFYLLTNQVIHSFLMALLYSLHPAKVEAVAWISGRPDLLSSAAIAAAVLCFFLYQKKVRGKRLFLAGVYILFILALLSKENAAVLPLMIAALVILQPFFPEFAGLKRTVKPMALMVAVMVGLLVAYLVIHNQFTGSANLASSFSMHHIPAMGKTIGVYVKMILAPFYPSPHFPMSDFDTGSLMLLFYLLIGLAVVIFVIINRDHYPMTLFSLVLSLMLIPVLNPELLPTHPKIALRFVYLPAVLAGAFFWETVSVFRSTFLKRVYLVLLFTLSAVWLTQVIHFQGFYENHRQHYQKMVALHPDDCSLLLPWALIQAQERELRQALQIVDRALILDKADRWIDISESASLLKANLLVAAGSLEPGRILAEKIVAGAEDAGVKYNGWLILAKYHEKREDFQAALGAIKKARTLGETGDLYFRMALIYDKMANFDDAIRAIRKALERHPGNETFNEFEAYLKNKYRPFPLKR